MLIMLAIFHLQDQLFEVFIRICHWSSRDQVQRCFSLVSEKSV